MPFVMFCVLKKIPSEFGVQKRAQHLVFLMQVAHFLVYTSSPEHYW